MKTWHNDGENFLLCYESIEKLYSMTVSRFSVCTWIFLRSPFPKFRFPASYLKPDGISKIDHSHINLVTVHILRIDVSDQEREIQIDFNLSIPITS